MKAAGSNNRHPALLPYQSGITGLGLLAVAFAISQSWEGGSNPQWLLLASLTILTGAFTVKVPGTNSKISIADTFVFTNILLFGPAAGTLTAALDGFMSSIRAKTVSRRVEYTLFNIGSMALSAMIAGGAFFRVLGRGPLQQDTGVTLSQVLLPVAVLAGVHYFCNTSFVSIIVALEARANIYRVWRESYLWAALVYLTCASVAALLALNVASITPVAFMSLLPVLLVTYFTYKTYLDKVKERLHAEQLRDLYLSTVESLALAVDAKDQTTYQHIHRVRAYAMGLAKHCGVTDPNELMAIETASLLHDIGKLAIDDYILNKPGPLSKQEFEKIKLHPSAGHEILSHVNFPFPVAKYVRSHHERWDGRGYPDGLKAENIPLGARILAIADGFDATRSSRPYKVSCGPADAVECLRSQAGTLYDPALVELFADHIDEMEAAAAVASRHAPALSFRKSAEGIQLDTQQSRAALTQFTHSSQISAELESLREFCSKDGRPSSFSDNLILIEWRMRRLLPFSTCVFYLGGDDELLRAVHASGKFAELLQDSTIGMGKGISGWVAAYQRPMFNTGPASEWEGSGMDFRAFTDCLSVPLLFDGACLGTITLYGEAPTFYTQDHVSILEVAATHVAPLVASARARRDNDPLAERIALQGLAGFGSDPSLASSPRTEGDEQEGSSIPLL